MKHNTPSDVDNSSGSLSELNNEDVKLPEGEYADFLASKAARIADERVMRRETKWRSLLTLILTVLALLGFTNISGQIDDATNSLSNTVDKQVEDQVKAKIEASVDQYFRDNWERLIGGELERLDKRFDEINNIYHLVVDIEDLTYLVEELEEGNSFTHSQRDDVVATIRRLSQSEEIRAMRSFSLAAEKSINSFYAASSKDAIRQIEDAIGDIPVKEQGITLTLIQHYGLIVLGAAGPAGERDIASLERYIASAKQHNYPEAALPYEMLLEFKQSDMKPNSDRIKNLFMEVKYLSPEEAVTFLDLFGNWLSKDTFATAEQERLCGLADKFYEAYRDQFSEAPGEQGNEIQ